MMVVVVVVVVVVLSQYRTPDACGPECYLNITHCRAHGHNIYYSKCAKKLNYGRIFNPVSQGSTRHFNQLNAIQ